MSYSEWLYEYERCYDLLVEYGLRFYAIIINLLEEVYPDYFQQYQEDTWSLEDEEVHD